MLGCAGNPGSGIGKGSESFWKSKCLQVTIISGLNPGKKKMIKSHSFTLYTLRFGQPAYLIPHNTLQVKQVLLLLYPWCYQMQSWQDCDEHIQIVDCAYQILPPWPQFHLAALATYCLTYLIFKTTISFLQLSSYCSVCPSLCYPLEVSLMLVFPKSLFSALASTRPTHAFFDLSHI